MQSENETLSVNVIQQKNIFLEKIKIDHISGSIV